MKYVYYLIAKTLEGKKKSVTIPYKISFDPFLWESYMGLGSISFKTAVKKISFWYTFYYIKKCLLNLLKGSERSSHTEPFIVFTVYGQQGNWDRMPLLH